MNLAILWVLLTLMIPELWCFQPIAMWTQTTTACLKMTSMEYSPCMAEGANKIWREDSIQGNWGIHYMAKSMWTPFKLMIDEFGVYGPHDWYICCVWASTLLNTFGINWYPSCEQLTSLIPLTTNSYRHTSKSSGKLSKKSKGCYTHKEGKLRTNSYAFEMECPTKFYRCDGQVSTSIWLYSLSHHMCIYFEIHLLYILIQSNNLYFILLHLC